MRRFGERSLQAGEVIPERNREDLDLSPLLPRVLVDVVHGVLHRPGSVVSPFVGVPDPTKEDPEIPVAESVAKKQKMGAGLVELCGDVDGKSPAMSELVR